MVTPSVNLSFKNAFNIQGGLVYNPSDNKNAAKAKKVLPFVTTAVDLLGVFNANSPVSWKLFASYAAAGRFADYSYQLSSVNPSNTNNMHPSTGGWPTSSSFVPVY